MQSPSADWRIPEGTVVYAIGDIHGRVDLLDDLLTRIDRDGTRYAASTTRNVVFLGDYIDRGPSSREVVERLLSDPLPRHRKTFLLGNHEQVLLRYLAGETRIARHWLHKGGIEALCSYGIRVTPDQMADERGLDELRRKIKKAIPKRHMAFFGQLKASHREGDYYFAHAGILPGTPLDQQQVRDLIWIRGRFHRSTVDHGVRVVHGHEVVPEVQVRTNRIGIDTGAYQTGVLTCLVLHADTSRFLQTRPGSCRGADSNHQERLSER